MARFPMLIVLLLAVGCKSKPSASTEKPADCDQINLGTQPTDRLPIGDVLWLPASSGGDCPEFQWELAADAEGVLLTGEPGFIPLSAASTVITETTTGQTIDVTGFDPSNIPFHNLMYQPTRSVEVVGDEVWVAEALAPRVARIDRSSGETIGSIAVGPWPTSIAYDPSLNLVAVTHAGNDTLGLIDVEAGQIVDAIWVGDEPSTVVIDSTTSLAYVTLETEHAVAVVDLTERTVTERLDGPRGPRALSLTDDGMLVVAGHRTGQPDRYPYAEDEGGPVDVQAIDPTTGEVLWNIEEAGNIITDIAIDEARSTVWITAIVSFPDRGLVTLETPPFEAQIQEYDLDSGEWLRTTVLGPTADGEGTVLGPQGLVVDEGNVWVAAQDSELVIELDAETMTESSRTLVPGGARALHADDGAVWVHANQAMSIHRIRNGEIESSSITGNDPRPEAVAAGQLHFIQPGESYGQNFSCNSCHYDGRGDTQVWRAGPFETWELSRPMMWLDGTAPLGWGAYVSDTRTFGFTGFASIIAVWPTTEMATDLAEFLASLMPPPKANGWTQRDGQLSTEAIAGQNLFNGKAGCSGCHGGALTTSNQTFEEGITEGRVSTPILVGAYRHNAWLKDGSAHTLKDATQAAAEWSGVTTLSDDELNSVVRYLNELTDRDFFLLRHQPEPSRGLIGLDEPITLTFNQPVWTGEDNADRVTLVDSEGALIEATVQIEDRAITVTPTDLLEPGETYTTTVDIGLESFDQRTLSEAIAVSFTTAETGEMVFEGRYVLAVDMPAFDFENDRFNPDVTVPAPNPFSAEASASGSRISFELNDGLEWETAAVIDGTSFEIPPVPVKAGNSLAQGSALRGTAEDTDGDGIIDLAEGSFTISGPGFHVEDVTWTIEPEVEQADCVPGADGAIAVSVTVTDTDVIIDWEGGAGALGLYVTTYGATLPMGPGTTVSNGDAFWAISTAAFPTGFVGPVVYGELPGGAQDDSELNGVPEGGADLTEGDCYQFSVITDTFQIGSYTVEL